MAKNLNAAQLAKLIKVLYSLNRLDLIDELLNSYARQKTFLEDYILEKTNNYTVIGITQGEPQIGKSTFNHFFMSNLHKLKYNEKWDKTRFCGRSLLEFSEIVKQYSNGYFITYEEPETDVSIDNWYDDFNHAFNLIVSTQGYKHNFYNLVLPASAQLSNRQRYFIKLGIEILTKIPELKRVVFRPTLYSRTFWRLDSNDLRYHFPPVSFIDYSEEDLKEAGEYTDWIVKTLKEPIMDEIIEKLRLKKEDKALIARKPENVTPVKKKFSNEDALLQKQYSF